MKYLIFTMSIVARMEMRQGLVGFYGRIPNPSMDKRNIKIHLEPAQFFISHCNIGIEKGLLKKFIYFLEIFLVA